MQWKRFTELVFWHIFGGFGGTDPETKALSLTPGSVDSPIHINPIEITPGSTCNTPTSRKCWTEGFNIETDYESFVPDGVVRQIYLEVSNGYLAPDGYNVSRLLFNGSYPGPLIEGNWGDTFNITIKNKLTNHNGTSVHWHGIRQLNTNWFDGVSGVTECPLSPGETFTYTWRAMQYGVSWYHSHFSLQYPDGLVGPLKINGPSSMDYDIDLGPVLITDHFHKDAFSQVQLEYLGRPPAPDSMLMNGNGTFYCCSQCSSPNKDPNCIGGSKLTAFDITPGKTYKMSLVNTATSTHMTFWIDKHDFRVIATDFVPINPYNASTLNIAIGQRYDIVFNASQDVAKYWIHVRDCSNGGARSNLGILNYTDSDRQLPYTPHISEEHLCYGCLDELDRNLVPVVQKKVPEPANIRYQEDPFKVHLVGYPNDEDRNSVMHKWVLKDSSFYLDWTQPSLSLLNVANDQGWKKPKFPVGYDPVNLGAYKEGEWVYFLIEGKFQEYLNETNRKIYKTQAPVAHPMHIHGHDFVILDQGTEEFVPAKANITTKNAPRRDVALLPVNGYLIIAFQINNPGAWLMHCHIAWHASGGLALQFIEQPEKITPLFKKSGITKAYSEQCTNWGAYYTVFNKNENATQEDSGI